jgi:hypothetical protein
MRSPRSASLMPPTVGSASRLYAVTTLYFETEPEDGLRTVGYSEGSRVDTQIVVGLPLDCTGFRLEIGCYERSTAECDMRSHAGSITRY